MGRLVRAPRKRRPVRYNDWNEEKQLWHKIVGISVRTFGIHPIKRAWFSFLWIERNRRRDKDNVAAGGRKLILDGLVEAGILPDDSWKYVVGWEDHFAVDKVKPGVRVTIFEG